MSNPIGAPNGIERRAFRVADSTLNNLPAADATVQVGCKAGQPLKEISDPNYLAQILQSQIDLAMERGYPLCLALLNVSHPQGQNVLQQVIQVLQDNLRPTDIVLLCPNGTVGLILHEANIEGGRRVCDRLKYIVSQTQGLAEARLEFGLSDRVTREPSRGESMLRSAERSVEHR